MIRRCRRSSEPPLEPPSLTTCAPLLASDCVDLPTTKSAAIWSEATSSHTLSSSLHSLERVTHTLPSKLPLTTLLFYCVNWTLLLLFWSCLGSGYYVLAILLGFRCLLSSVLNISVSCRVSICCCCFCLCPCLVFGSATLATLEIHLLGFSFLLCFWSSCGFLCYYCCFVLFWCCLAMSGCTAIFSRPQFIVPIWFKVVIPLTTHQSRSC